MDSITLNDFISPNDFVKKYPQYKYSRVRTWISESKPRKGARGELPANGFAECLKRDGRSILLIEPKVLEWLLTRGDNGEARNG